MTLAPLLTPAPSCEERSASRDFSSVVCVADATPAGQAARRQAVALAAGGAAVESVAVPRRAWREPQTVMDLAEGADVLVVGSGTVPDSILGCASVPVLLSRWLPVDAAIAARVLVVVEPAVEPTRAAELAAQLAAQDDGDVYVLPSLARDRKLQRALAATQRIVLQRRGALPAVVGEDVVREAAVATAVRDLDASLLVLPLGDTSDSRAGAASIARHVSCPVLAVPA